MADHALSKNGFGQSLANNLNIMPAKIFNLIIAVIFSLMAGLHLLRLVFGWPAIIGDVGIPLWASAVAIVAASFLAYQSYKLSKSQ